MELNLNALFSTGALFAQPPALDPTMLYDLLIVGAGPAGLNAALYAKRKGLDVAILTKRKGGQVMDTSIVDNYLGIENLSGEGLVEQFLSHLHKLDVPILEDAEVIGVEQEGPQHRVRLMNGGSYQSKALLIATGSTPRRLGVPGEQAYAGKGVAYCAICDAPLFKGKDVFVAGGGNSAVEAALDLAKLANSVTLVHRSELRADKILIDQLLTNDKIDVHLRTQILEIQGNVAMTHLQVKDLATDHIYTLPGDGIFIEIGHIPNLGPFEPLLKLNEHGEILVDDKNQTSIPGIFAAGDVTQIPYKQIIMAVGDGAKAALAANDYIHQHKF